MIRTGMDSLGPRSLAIETPSRLPLGVDRGARDLGGAATVTRYVCVSYVRKSVTPFGYIMIHIMIMICGRISPAVVKGRF